MRQTGSGGATTTWTTRELQRELDRFEAELRGAGLKEASIRTYVDRSRTFVRWLAGEYIPGGRQDSSSR